MAFYWILILAGMAGLIVLAHLGRNKGGIWRLLRWSWRVVLGYCVVLAVMRVAFAWPRMHSAGDFALYLLGMTEDSTVYAKGFSEKGFWKVQPGMSRKEVESLAGQPLWKRDWDAGAVWTYSSVRCPEGCVTCDDGFYWKRDVVFDAEGKVKSVAGQYWDD